MYVDSVLMMSLETKIRNISGVLDCFYLMATPKNLKMLKRKRMLSQRLSGLTGEDFLVSVKIRNKKCVDDIEKVINELLAKKRNCA